MDSITKKTDNEKKVRGTPICRTRTQQKSMCKWRKWWTEGYPENWEEAVLPKPEE